MFIVLPRVRMRISVLALPMFLIILWLEGTAPFFVMMSSAAAHELGHLAAIKLCGYRPRRIDILPMGALIVCPEGIPYREETVIAVSGPLVSLVCALASSVWFSASGEAIALYSTAINLVLGLFNLFPVKKLDGGKALFCFLAHRFRNKKETAEHFCSAVSVLSKLLFVGIALLCIKLSEFNAGVILLSAALVFQIVAD